MYVHIQHIQALLLVPDSYSVKAKKRQQYKRGRILFVYIDVVEWSRALDVRLSEWCCSVSMVWVQIPSREQQKFDSLKSNSNTVWFNFQTYIYIITYFISICSFMHA